MWYRLALVFGCSVSEVQAKINSREFSQWCAYYQLEPFGPRADDRRAGVIAATIANANRDKKKRSKPYTWLDFFPERKSREAKPWQDLLLAIEGINAALGGEDKRVNKEPEDG